MGIEMGMVIIWLRRLGIGDRVGETVVASGSVGHWRLTSLPLCGGLDSGRDVGGGAGRAVGAWVGDADGSSGSSSAFTSGGCLNTHFAPNLHLAPNLHNRLGAVRLCA